MCRVKSTCRLCVASYPEPLYREVMFMDEGVVVESGAPAEVLGSPCHERTRAFLSKVL